ncbi:hypothetical protein [Streptomyces sp. NPDC017941]|uniref:hypothetical protein n=1 Tax=Streptomyces sp. NPDC017941 TaxID=3365018 RepID=UPI0037B7B88F
MGRPGRLGRRRDELVGRWTQEYGPGNWRLAWQAGPVCHGLDGALALYEDAYFAALSQDQKLLDTLVGCARDVYDEEERDTASGLDYAVQASPATHLQDISVRRVLVRLGRWFEGDALLRVRAPGQGEEDAPHERTRAALDSGRLPFHRPDLIVRPLLTGWWQPFSVECFYQSNKLLQKRTA